MGSQGRKKSRCGGAGTQQAIREGCKAQGGAETWGDAQRRGRWGGAWEGALGEERGARPCRPRRTGVCSPRPAVAGARPRRPCWPPPPRHATPRHADSAPRPGHLTASPASGPAGRRLGPEDTVGFCSAVGRGPARSGPAPAAESQAKCQPSSLLGFAGGCGRSSPGAPFGTAVSAH